MTKKKSLFDPKILGIDQYLSSCIIYMFEYYFYPSPLANLRIKPPCLWERRSHLSKSLSDLKQNQRYYTSKSIMVQFLMTTVMSYQNESVSSKWELPFLPPSSLELWRKERAKRQLSFWWKTLILIGHYGTSLVIFRKCNNSLPQSELRKVRLRLRFESRKRGANFIKSP